MPVRSEQPAPDYQVPDVSIIELIAKPENYSGKYIRLVGYMTSEHRKSALYLNPLDAKYLIDKNAIWLYPNKKLNPDSMNGHFVIVQGIFSSTDKGEWDGCSGSLKNVDRMQLAQP